jgi:hypothetical protein
MKMFDRELSFIRPWPVQNARPYKYQALLAAVSFPLEVEREMYLLLEWKRADANPGSHSV